MSESFSINAFNKVYSSNFFYSSEYKERRVKDEGSLSRTLESRSIYLLDTKEMITHSLFKQGCQAGARIVVGIAIGVFSIFGILYNTVRVVSVLFATSEKGRIKYLDLKKAISADLSFFVFTCTLVPLSGFIFSFFNADPMSLSQLLLSKEERIAFLKAIEFRKYFGFVNQNGQLLKADPKEDGEFFDLKKGFLRNHCAREARQFLYLIEQLQNSLPKPYRMIVPYQEPPTVARIKSDLDYAYKKLNETEKKNVDIQKLSEVLTQTEKKMRLLMGFIKDCLHVSSIAFFDERTRITVPSFILEPTEVKNCYQLKDSTAFQTQLETTLEDLKKVEESGPYLLDSPPEVYRTFKELIKTKPKIYEILGLDLIHTEDEVNKAFRKLSLRLHPDKVLLESERILKKLNIDAKTLKKELKKLKIEAQAVFNLASYVRDQLLKKFNLT